jgi:DNA replicative helicase MCM subunit Mcm2 (Cdc46/Mcm family)
MQLLKYIRYAKTLIPRITDSAKRLMVRMAHDPGATEKP